MPIFNFQLPMEEAADFWRDKLHLSPGEFYALTDEAKVLAFSVSGIAKGEELTTVYNAMDKALKQGITFEEWKAQAADVFERRGWTGQKAWRLDTIFRTNIQTAYNVGRYQQMMRATAGRPYWRYSAVNDSRTRPAHRAMHGRIFPADSPVWDTWYPPNGFRCRCSVNSVSQDNLDSNGWSVETTDPTGKLYEPTDPDTGVKMPARLLMPDPGFMSNPAKNFYQHADQVMQDSLSRMEPRIAAKVKAEWEAHRPPQLPPPKPPRVRKVKEPDPEWSYIPNSQKGSNLGGLYEDATGQRHYVKFYQDPAQAHTEKAAVEVQRMLGLEVPELQTRMMTAPDGQKRLGLASKWLDGLQRMTPEQMAAHPDLPKMWQATKLTNNWDVVGLEYDNLMLTQDGRMICIDSGGSFKFRARGNPKGFATTADDWDMTKNEQAQRVFGKAFEKNVFLEADGAPSLLKLEKKGIDKALKGAGFKADEAKELSGTLMQRREYLIDRYNADGRYTYEGFGKHLDEFKKWGAGKLTEQQARDMTPGMVVNQFEQYLRDTHGEPAIKALQLWFKEWSSSSQTSFAAGLIKNWSTERFGLKGGFHNWKSGAQAKEMMDIHTATIERAAKLPRGKLYEFLDTEYELHQYYLRRVHGYDGFKVQRKMDAKELKEVFKDGVFEPKNATCTAYPDGTFSNTHLLEIEARTEDVLKSYNQGPRYMRFYTKSDYKGSTPLPNADLANEQPEHEYVYVGRKAKARKVY